jgi:hypothetical protein
MVNWRQVLARYYPRDDPQTGRRLERGQLPCRICSDALECSETCHVPSEYLTVAELAAEKEARDA